MRALSQRKPRQRGVALIIYTLLLTGVILPLIGLGIDLNILYIVQAKLSAAVDGAALGAGRLLGSGANIEEIAGEFLDANFPEGYWGAAGLVKEIKYDTSLNTHTITVAASVDVPLFFMRIFRQGSTKVSASGVATRKEMRVAFVLDRSASLSPSVFSTLKGAAMDFAENFHGGVDELALVVYSNSGVVLYPPLPGPWDKSPTGTDGVIHGGADTNFMSNHTPGGIPQPDGDLLDHLEDLQKGGYTSMAEGLSMGWIELQKAFNKDGLGDADLRANFILLFTDGVPTALAVDVNPSTGNALKLPCSSGQSRSACATAGRTPCTHNPATTDVATKMIGRLNVGNPTPPFTGGSAANSASTGLFELASRRDGATAVYWAENADTETAITGSSGPVAGCFADENVDGLRYPPSLPLRAGRLGDLAKIPDHDYYENATGGTAYTSSTVVYTGAPYQATVPTVGYNLGLAAWNATDNAAYRIRTDSNMKIAIHVIGYTGTTGIDDVLLKRIANAAGTPWHNPGQPTGLYVPAGNEDALAQAFQTIASEILRLAQ
jgi:hypothetical protein